MSQAEAAHILVVEDDPDARANMRDILEIDGYGVETAASLTAAMSERDWDRVFAVILDRRLPDGMAEDVLPQISELAPHAAIIIVTGYADVESAVAAIRHGATDYLLKPIQPETLLSRLSQIAGRRQAEALFQVAIDAAPTSMLLTDSVGNVVFGNEQAVQAFGYERDELLGKDLRSIVPDVDANSSGRTMLEVATEWSAKQENSELVARHRDASTFPCEVTLTPVRSTNEKLVLAVVQDITQRKRAEELREVEIQLDIARSVQQQLYPTESPSLPGFDIAGAAYPADAAGGDYFDFLPIPNQCLAVVVGDVAGHGIGPALLMAMTRAYLRAAVESHQSPGDTVTHVNRLLAVDTAEDRFVTLFLAVLDPDRRELRYAGAGHPAHLLKADGSFKTISATGLMLGIYNDSDIKSGEPIQLEAGDILLLMTDGIWESTHTDGSMFGMERAIQLAQKHRDQAATEIVDQLYHAAMEYGNNEQTDDITVIVVKVLDKPES